jgi:prepilin-type processing-associated H-X9-DG protein
LIYWAQALRVLLASGLLIFFNTFIKPDRQRSHCQSNLKKLGLAVMQYVRNYDEVMPMAVNWNDALLPYIRNGGESGTALYVTQFHCPSRTDWKYGYSLHQRVERKSLAVIYKPDKAVLFFDSESNRRNAADNGQSLSNPPRHYGSTNNICYVDGHVKAQKQVDFLDGINWQLPKKYERIKDSLKRKPVKSQGQELHADENKVSTQ